MVDVTQMKANMAIFMTAAGPLCMFTESCVGGATLAEGSNPTFSHVSKLLGVCLSNSFQVGHTKTIYDKDKYGTSSCLRLIFNELRSA